MNREPIEAIRGEWFVPACDESKVRKLEQDYAELEEKLKVLEFAIDLVIKENRASVSTIQYCIEALKTITGES